MYLALLGLAVKATAEALAEMHLTSSVDLVQLENAEKAMVRDFAVAVLRICSAVFAECDLLELVVRATTLAAVDATALVAEKTTPGVAVSADLLKRSRPDRHSLDGSVWAKKKLLAVSSHVAPGCRIGH